MNHRDAEMSDIVVVLTECADDQFDKIVDQIKATGVSISETDKENGVVNGTCESSKIKELQKLSCVKYVRSVFDWVADYPPGDPRDKDGPEVSDLDDEDGR